MQIIVDSLLTRYRISGEGKPVLLLHGWGDNSDGLKGLQDALSAKYQVIALDLPGFGGTQPPEGVWGLDDYADFVTHFLVKIGVAGELGAVVGHSNGGAIAVRGLASGRFLAERLVLLASAGIRGEDKGRMNVVRAITKAGKVFTAPLPKSVKRKLRSKVYKTVGSDMLVAEHLQGTFKKIVADDVRTDAAQLKLPTLLIYGDKDESTPLAFGRILNQAIKGSKLEVLPGAGHFAHLDEAGKVARLVEGFIK